MCVYSITVCVYMAVHISWGTRRSQKITWGCGFSPSTLWNLGLELGTQTQVTSLSITHRGISPVFKGVFCSTFYRGI